MSTVIDNIVGIATLPVSVLLLLSQWGIIHAEKIFGVNLVLLGAIALVAVQVANLVATHIHGEWVVLSYILHILCLFPALLYFLSLVLPLPAGIAASLPLLITGFLLVEGLYSFYF